MTKTTESIRSFIVAAVAKDPGGVARQVCEAYGISRQAVNRHLRAMVASGILEESGQTRAKSYRLRPMATFVRQFRRTPALREDRVWREHMAPHFGEVAPNIRDICQYGFTEALNNAIHHSGASRITVALAMSAAAVTLSVTDDGDGIFAVITDRLDLADPYDATFELAKGRLTTAPAAHGGMGLFFTTRACDTTEIQSGSTTAVATPETWTIRDERVRIRGTSVRMHLALSSERGLEDVLDTYAGSGAVARATVPLALLESVGGRLVSRAQAHRVLSRLDGLSEVILDFAGVELVGPSFADEIFRAYRSRHPGVTLVTLNAAPDVRARIRAAIGSEVGATR